jgi:hypothetical protein
MRRRYWSLSPLLLLAGIATAQQPPAPPANLVMNAGLEEPLEANGLPRGWYRYAKPPEGFQVTVADGAGRAETKAIRITGAGDYAGATANKVPFELGKEYALRGWVRLEGEAGARAGLKLDLYDQAGKYVASTPSQTTAPLADTGWALIARVERPERYPEARQCALSCTVNGKGTALFDDLELLTRPADPQNLLADGGMECVTAQKQTRWRLSVAGGGSGTLVRRTVPVKEGWYAMQILAAGDWATASTDPVPLDRGKKYTLTGWARVRSGQAKLQISYLQDGMYVGNTQCRPHRENAWAELSLVAEPEKFPTANQIAAAANATGDVDVIFDAFKLRAE